MPDNHVDFPGATRGDFLRGARLTGVDDLHPAGHLLTLRLLNRRGAAMGSRPAIVWLRRDTAVTVLTRR